MDTCFFLLPPPDATEGTPSPGRTSRKKLDSKLAVTDNNEEGKAGVDPGNKAGGSAKGGKVGKAPRASKTKKGGSVKGGLRGHKGRSSRSSRASSAGGSASETGASSGDDSLSVSGSDSGSVR
jgi:hypothetical protein